KNKAELTIGIQIGIWVSLLFLFGAYVTGGGGLALVAGNLARRHGGGWPLGLRYVEVAVPIAFFVVVTLESLLNLFVTHRPNDLVFTMILALLALTIPVILCNGHPVVRVVLQASWLGAFLARQVGWI